MAKTQSKRRRNSRSRGNPRNYSQIYKDDNSAPAASAAADKPTPVDKDEPVDWTGEYGYVLQDLRLLAIVSILIFVGMIGAGLIWA